MRANPVNWFEIYVQDMDRARKFYGTVLGGTIEKLPGADDIEMWTFKQDMDKPGAAGALVHMPGMPSGGNSTIVYFYCDDVADEASRVVDAGGKSFKDKFSIGPYGFIALAYDPDGNMFGLHSLK